MRRATDCGVKQLSSCGRISANERPKKAEQIVADGEIEHYLDRFLAAGGCPERLGRCGSYGDFYAQWREFAPAAPHLHLRYEDMVANPAERVTEIANFLQIPVGDADRVVARVEQRTQLDGRFFWRKRAYNFREMLSAALIARFEAEFAEPLRELGY